MIIKRFFKQLVFTKTYLNLYPLSEKENIVDKINNCDLDDDSDFSKALNSLCDIIISEKAKMDFESKEIDRSLKPLYKKEKVEVTDNETGNTTKKKVKVEKEDMFSQQEFKRCNEKLSEIDTTKKGLQELLDSIDKSEFKEEYIPLCDKLLRKNRIAQRVYAIGLISIILIPIIIAIVSNLR